jgi:hypothetical protein
VFCEIPEVWVRAESGVSIWCVIAFFKDILGTGKICFFILCLALFVALSRNSLTNAHSTIHNDR